MRGQIGVQRHQCPLCPKSFQSPNDLDKHLRKIHGTSRVAALIASGTQPSNVKVKGAIEQD